MGLVMAGKKAQKKRFRPDDGKVSICGQARAAGVSAAQVARRYAMNANLIHKWLRDPRFAPTGTDEDGITAEATTFLPIEIEGTVSSPSASQLGALVTETATRIRVAFASACPDKALFVAVLMKLPGQNASATARAPEGLCPIDPGPDQSRKHTHNPTPHE